LGKDEQFGRGQGNLDPRERKNRANPPACVRMTAMARGKGIQSRLAKNPVGKGFAGGGGGGVCLTPRRKAKKDATHPPSKSSSQTTTNKKTMKKKKSIEKGQKEEANYK